LQTRHTVDSGDMDTDFVIYRWIKTLKHLYNSNNNNCYTLNTANKVAGDIIQVNRTSS